jgi:hypothetical protein
MRFLSSPHPTALIRNRDLIPSHRKCRAQKACPTYSAEWRVALVGRARPQKPCLQVYGFPTSTLGTRFVKLRLGETGIPAGKVSSGDRWEGSERVDCLTANPPINPSYGLSVRIPASHHHPGKLDASARAQILLATLAQPARSATRLAQVEGKAVPLETGQRVSWDLASGAQLHAATVLSNARLRRWGLWVPSDFAPI